MPAYDQNISSEFLTELKAHVGYLDQSHEEMLSLVIELCDINSGTFNLDGIDKVASVLRREFDCFGEPIEYFSIDGLKDVDDSGTRVEKPLGKMLRIVKRPDVRPRVLLCIHMDTVYGSENSFQKCTDMGSGKINGPGVADAKGGLVVMLYALKALEASPLANQIGWEVLINPDEELGSPGSADYLMERAALADVGLLFEPKLPDGALVSARKGVGNFAFVVRGRSAHSGREFLKGRNAVVKCCELMQRVHSLNTNTQITYNVGRLNGGAALNVVPDTAVGRVNVRVGSAADMELVQKQFDSLVHEFDGHDGFEVELHGDFTSHPKELTPKLSKLKDRVQQCAQELGINVAWKDTGGASDGNKFAAAGLTNIDTLGPVGGEIHSSNEYLVAESLTDSAKLAAMVMISLAGKS